jgi:hypothetical protein
MLLELVEERDLRGLHLLQNTLGAGAVRAGAEDAVAHIREQSLIAMPAFVQRRQPISRAIEEQDLVAACVSAPECAVARVPTSGPCLRWAHG